MRILITNDDGINAAQLIPLAKWCQKLGDVTVIAPKYKQSGKSQSIEIHKPYEVKKIDLVPGIPVYTVDSTPADCIRFARFGLGLQFDLVISGINRGYNLGTDVMYSGTAGAAFEAVSQGMKAISMSTSPDCYEQAVGHLDSIFDFILGNKLLECNDIYNINIPPEPKGIRITRMGGHYFSDDFKAMGNDTYIACGKLVYTDRGDDTRDMDAVMHGYISVMPMTINRTNMDVFHRLSLLDLK